MNLPKTILVPLDFGQTSNAALDYAVALAKKLEARVHVLHAYTVPVTGFAEGGVLITSELVTQIVDGAQKALDRIAAEHPGTVVEKHIKQQEPWSAILDTAAEIHADLIVMGTHGRTGIPRFLIGSVAEKTLRLSPIPVLTVRNS